MRRVVNPSPPDRPADRRLARPAIAAAIGILLCVDVETAAVLRDADITISFRSPLVCEVDAAFTIDQADGAAVEHRIHVLDGGTVELRGIDGSMSVSGLPNMIGRTQSLILRPTAAGPLGYRLRYRATQPQDGAYRCPLWLPTTPADGRSRRVAVSVALPAGAVPAGGGLPPLAWRENHGTARLGHVPASVRVPYSSAGEAGGPGLSITAVMDATALTVLGCGSAFFLWRRRR
jgi:hypothetical protein